MTSAGPSVSVALCTHNGAEFLAAQLESILAQMPPPREVVISDDASTDDTLAVARGVAERFPLTEFRILANPVALGVVANFEQAVLACTGDLIALSDQDDVWKEGRLQRVADEFSARPGLLLLASDATLIDVDGAPFGNGLIDALEISRAELAGIRAGKWFETLLHRNLMTGATMAFRRSLLDVAIPFARSWVHDEWLACIAAATGTIDLLPEQLIGYRQHAANQIGARRKSLFAKLLVITQPRAERNARLLARAGDLLRRLESLGSLVDGARLEDARGKLAHEAVRNTLPVARLRRIAPVVREVSTGRYATYGRGAMDVLRDLVQPAR